MTRTFSLLVTAASAGCFESIAPGEADANVSVDAIVLGPYTTTRQPDGSYATVVDSTSMTDWVYGDFETGEQSDPDDPWDLRFQRFHISTNGGVSGTGGVEVVPVSAAFGDVAVAPVSGWISDATDGDDANMDPDYAFEQGDGWYDYDPATHVLTPKPLVWVVRTNGGSTIKVEITGYYNDAGTAGWFSLHWSPL